MFLFKGEAVSDCSAGVEVEEGDCDCASSVANSDDSEVTLSPSFDVNTEFNAISTASWIS
jgi:hypothetical protein